MIPASCPWGDSLIDQMFRSTGSPSSNGWPENIFLRGGVSGDSSTAIKVRFLADTTRRNWNQIFWIGGHNSFNATTIKDDLAAMIAATPHDRVLVIGSITNGNLASDQGPAGAHWIEVRALNAELKALYGLQFYDALEFLALRGQAAGNARAIANFVPSSVDQPSDIHLIAAAYNALLVDVRARMQGLGYLSESAGDEQLTLAGSRLLAKSAPNITSANSGSVQEQRPFSLTLTSDDPQAEFAIVGGADQAKFTLVDDLGEENPFSRKHLTMEGKDFEVPEDADANNQYVVVVEASDGQGRATQQTITVSVTDTDDAAQFTETSDYIARMTFPPHSEVQGYIDRFIRKAIAHDYWENLSAIYLMANSDQQSARLNLKGTTGTLTNSGALHIEYQGFSGDGVDDYVDGIAFRTLDATLNRHSVGAFVYSNSDIADSGADIGASNSSNFRMHGRNASGNNEAYPLSATQKLTAVPDSFGLYGFQRLPAGSFTYVAGQALTDGIGEPVELPTGTFRFLSANGASFSKRTLMVAGITNKMPAAKWHLLNANLTELCDALNLFVPAPVPAPRFTCHFEGANGATTAVDEDGGKTINFEGDAALSTSSPIEGASSLLLPATPPSYVWMADSPDWQLPLQFTIRCRFRTTNLGSDPKRSTLIGHNNTVDNQRSYQLTYNYQGRLQFDYSTDGTTGGLSTIQTGTGVVAINTNYEAMVDRDSLGVIRLYIANLDEPNAHADMVASSTFAGDFFDSNARLTIGCNENETNQVIGVIDSTIIWKNEAIVGSDAGYDPLPPEPRFRCLFEGADGATVASDLDGGKTIVFTGNAQIDTAEALEGNSSLRLDGTGDYVSMADHADFNLKLRFSLRARFQLASLAGGTYKGIIAKWTNAGNQRSYELAIRNDGSVNFFYSLAGTDTVQLASATSLVVADTPYEVQVDRDTTGKIRVYLADLTDVTPHADMVASSAGITSLFFDSTSPVFIGDAGDHTSEVNGWIDYVYIYSGETLTGSDAGYDPDFTPPAPTGKVMYQQLRFPNQPDFSPWNVTRHQMAYESEFFSTSNHSGAPVESYVRGQTIPRLKARWPGIRRLAVDIESWNLVNSGSQSGSGASAVWVPNQDFINKRTWKVQIMQWLHADWPGVKFCWYGELPIRDSNHLTGGSVANIERTAVWKSKNTHLLPCVETVDYFMPSVYAVNDRMKDDMTESDLLDLWWPYMRDQVLEARRLDNLASVNPNTRQIIPAIYIERAFMLDHSNTWNYASAYGKLRMCMDSLANGGMNTDGALWWSRASGGSANFFPAGTLSSPPNASVYSSIDPAEWWDATKDIVDDLNLQLGET